MSEKETHMWSKLYHSFVRLNPRSSAYCDSEYDSLLRNSGRVCGVIYRGTTYTKGQAKGHPVQPTMEMLAEKVNEVFKEKNCEKIYLASDEKSIVEFFNKRFPGKVIINKRMYYDEADVDYCKYNVDGTDITGDLFYRDNNEYLIGIEYISSMYLVSKCCCFVGGACGGTTAVQYINGNQFENSYIFELGKYGV